MPLNESSLELIEHADCQAHRFQVRQSMARCVSTIVDFVQYYLHR
jgi:hypothetical protein